MILKWVRTNIDGRGSTGLGNSRCVSLPPCRDDIGYWHTPFITYSSGIIVPQSFDISLCLEHTNSLNPPHTVAGVCTCNYLTDRDPARPSVVYSSEMQSLAFPPGFYGPWMLTIASAIFCPRTVS